MNSHRSLDRQSFEAFLENALVVQRSGLDQRSLSAIVDVQRFIMTATFDVDRALDLIAQRALDVANASGVSIALLEASQLVYRAASGSAAIEVGRRMPAVFAGCAHGEAREEILRVENAQTDSRVQAEICRQFGAMSMLILPICDNGVIGGVIQVHFSQAHSFLDTEVRTYRLMTRLVEDAISRDFQRTQNEVTTTGCETTCAVTCDKPQERAFSESDESPMSEEHKSPRPETVLVKEDVAQFRTSSARYLGQNVNRLLENNAWLVAFAMSAAVLLAIGIQIPFGHHPAPSSIGSVSSVPNEKKAGFLPAPVSVSTHRKRSIHRMTDERAPLPGFRKIKIGPNEEDYVAEDVTIRHFGSHASEPKTQTNEKEVKVGEDVTVRYFANRSTVLPTASTSPTRQATK
jgi:hypothetical protein